MVKFSIRLNTTDEIKEFVSILNGFKTEAVIKSERYVVNAKSILGIFSLNLSKSLTLEIDNPTEIEVKRLEKFIMN